MDINEAKKIVGEAITKRRAHLKSYLENKEKDSIMLEGETVKGYYCKLFVDPKDVAVIMLRYDYAMYEILEEDAPDAMWGDIAVRFGLDTVSSVDI